LTKLSPPGYSVHDIRNFQQKAVPNGLFYYLRLFGNSSFERATLAVMGKSGLLVAFPKPISKLTEF
jgi:hypothetical protein